MTESYTVSISAPSRNVDRGRFALIGVYTVAQMCNTAVQRGCALRSSIRGESTLTVLNHEAAFSVVDCYPRWKRGFFFGCHETKKAASIGVDTA